MDAISLYDQTTLECSKLITQRYSTSFTLGIKTLAKKGLSNDEDGFKAEFIRLVETVK